MTDQMPWFVFRRSYGRFFFRVFGYGLRVSDRSKVPALFSERLGLVRVLRIGRWSIRFLRPVKEVLDD